MAEASIELWAVVGGIAGVFVIAMLTVLARWIAQDAEVRRLRDEVIGLRTEYARRTAEAEIVEAEEARLESIFADAEPAERKAA